MRDKFTQFLNNMVVAAADHHFEPLLFFSSFETMNRDLKGFLDVLKASNSN